MHHIKKENPELRELSVKCLVEGLFGLAVMSFSMKNMDENDFYWCSQAQTADSVTPQLALEVERWQLVLVQVLRHVVDRFTQLLLLLLRHSFHGGRPLAQLGTRGQHLLLVS